MSELEGYLWFLFSWFSLKFNLNAELGQNFVWSEKLGANCVDNTSEIP